MLQVTLDAFSGRPNPSWVVSDFSEANALFTEISRNRSAITDVDGNAGFSGLGFRGAIFEVLSDETELVHDIAQIFSLRARAQTVYLIAKTINI